MECERLVRPWGVGDDTHRCTFLLLTSYGGPGVGRRGCENSMEGYAAHSYFYFLSGLGLVRAMGCLSSLMYPSLVLYL